MGPHVISPLPVSNERPRIVSSPALRSHLRSARPELSAHPAKHSAGIRACALPPPRGPGAEGAVRLRGRSGSGSRSAAAAPRGAGQGRGWGGLGSAGRRTRSGRPEERRMSATLYVLSTLGGYVLTSALLLKCPGLLHRPKRQRFRCRHISHRGGEWGAGRRVPPSAALPLRADLGRAVPAARRSQPSSPRLILGATC